MKHIFSKRPYQTFCPTWVMRHLKLALCRYGLIKLDVVIVYGVKVD